MSNVLCGPQRGGHFSIVFSFALKIIKVNDRVPMEKIVITFIVPAVSPLLSKDWSADCLYLSQTIASIYNSNDSRYRLIVVGHEAPDFQMPSDERFKFIQVDFEPPSSRSYYNCVRDKFAKVDMGWRYAKQHWKSDYVMIVDSDDFISCRLVSWLAEQPDAPGYRIVNGWVWNNGARFWMEHHHRFDCSCGTSIIIRSDLADLGVHYNTVRDYESDGLTVKKNSAGKLLPPTEVRTLLLNGRHPRAGEQFARHGYRIEVIPFPAAVYRVGNIMSLSSRNHKIKSLRMLLGRIRRMRFISTSLRQEFIIPEKVD